AGAARRAGAVGSAGGAGSPPARTGAPSAAEAIAELCNDGTHVGIKIVPGQQADVRRRVRVAGLLVELEPRRYLAAARLFAEFDADRDRVELAEPVIGRRELRHALPVEQNRAVEVRGVLRVETDVRLQVSVRAEVPAIA